MSTQVRPASPGDPIAVLDLWRRADAEPTSTDDVDSLAGLLARDPAALMVIDEAGVILATVIAAWDGWRASLYRLVVDPGHRRSGLGRAMVEKAERRFDGLGARRVQVIVVEGSEPAEEFWSSVGYEAQTARRRYVRDLTPSG